MELLFQLPTRRKLLPHIPARRKMWRLVGDWRVEVYWLLEGGGYIGDRRVEAILKT